MAINSLETDSNKQTITSNVSGSTLNNNNKSSGNNQQQQAQQQQQSATESKENNFEYDDNEWDVGGIGDLIKDLDNDIKKTSETVSQTVNSTSEQSSSSGGSGGSTASISSNNSRSSSSSPSSLSTPSNTSTASAQLNQNSQSIGTSSIQSNRSIEQDTSRNKKDTIENTTTDKSGKAKSVPASSTSTEKGQTVKTSFVSTKPSAQLTKQNHSTTNDQESGFGVTPKSTINKALELIALDKITIGNMSSNTAGQTSGKTGNKVAVDHQATLDKGLKMKIKRTKPGTKTSEAKHEIVKAEQNGSLSGADDINP